MCVVVDGYHHGDTRGSILIPHPDLVARSIHPPIHRPHLVLGRVEDEGAARHAAKLIQVQAVGPKIILVLKLVHQEVDVVARRPPVDDQGQAVRLRVWEAGAEDGDDGEAGVWGLDRIRGVNRRPSVDEIAGIRAWIDRPAYAPLLPLLPLLSRSAPASGTCSFSSSWSSPGRRRPRPAPAAAITATGIVIYVCAAVRAAAGRRLSRWHWRSTQRRRWQLDGGCPSLHPPAPASASLRLLLCRVV